MPRPEIWRAIPGYMGLYEASDRGRVRSLDCVKVTQGRWGTTKRGIEGRILCASEGSGGYLHVTLCDMQGGRATKRVHSLVAAAFFGPAPPDQVVRHKDGDKANCRKSNLAYGTADENAADAVKHGTQVHGESHPGAKLSESDVRLIRSKYRTMPHWRIGEMFDVSRSAVGRVLRKEGWRHVA